MWVRSFFIVRQNFENILRSHCIVRVIRLLHLLVLASWLLLFFCKNRRILREVVLLRELDRLKALLVWSLDSSWSQRGWRAGWTHFESREEVIEWQGRCYILKFQLRRYRVDSQTFCSNILEIRVWFWLHLCPFVIEFICFLD